jgi:hypothetical protein
MSASRNFMPYKFSPPKGSLKDIKKFLDTHAVPESSDLKVVLKQLSKIKRSVTVALKAAPLPFQSHLKEEENLLQTLAGRCQQLQERRDVINLAEEAENLANTSPEKTHDDVALEANRLRTLIDLFLKSHRPSRNNAKFIRFARACIDKAERHEALIQSKRSSKQVSLEVSRKNVEGPESVELAESLYELASLLYQEKIDLFNTALANNFSCAAQKEIAYHASVCKGNLKALHKKEDRLKVIQAILGYAHLLADYYMDNTPYPTIVEIHHLFEELELVNHLEKADLSAK